MLDIYAILERFGVAIAIIGVLVYLLWKFVIDPRIDEVCKSHREMIKATKEMRSAFKDPITKDSIIELHELRTSIDTMGDMIEKRCGTMSCPAVKLVETFTKSAYDRLDERLMKAEEAVIQAELDSKKFRDEKWILVDNSLRDFRDEAKVSREETQKLIKQIFDRVYEFTERTGLALITAVQARVEKNGIHKKGATDVK